MRSWAQFLGLSQSNRSRIIYTNPQIEASSTLTLPMSDKVTIFLEKDLCRKELIIGLSEVDK